MDNGTPAELTAYAYDGVGNRISQAIGTSSPVVTQYLLDTQPGLTKILAQTTDGNTDRFIHSQRAPQAGFPSVSILAHQDNSGDWFHAVQDGLGSVRSIADDVLVVQGMQHYTPYGSPFGVQGSLGMPFGFTGEQTDANELVYLRARYLNPGIGAFVSLDPFEGIAQRPMSLNGYGWVEGNVVNMVDPSGLCWNNSSEPQYRRQICLDAFRERFPLSIGYSGYGLLNDYAIEHQHEWSRLPYNEFVDVWNRDMGIQINEQLLTSGMTAAFLQSQAIPGVPDPGDATGAITAALTLVGVACLAGLAYITRPIPYDFAAAESGWIRDIPFTKAGEGDWSDAIPNIRSDPPKSCNDPRLQSLPKCNYNLYDGFSSAFNALNETVKYSRGVSIDNSFDPENWELANTCDGGLHWNIPGRGGWDVADDLIASIRCCPCCDDFAGIVIFSWNCHLNPKF